LPPKNAIERNELILNLAPEIACTTRICLAKDHEGGREH
jgi:hypothetical protein